MLVIIIAKVVKIVNCSVQRDIPWRKRRFSPVIIFYAIQRCGEFVSLPCVGSPFSTLDFATSSNTRASYFSTNTTWWQMTDRRPFYRASGFVPSTSLVRCSLARYSFVFFLQRLDLGLSINTSKKYTYNTLMTPSVSHDWNAMDNANMWRAYW